VRADLGLYLRILRRAITPRGVTTSAPPPTLGAAASDQGSVTGSLPFGRVLGLKVASTFVSLAGSGPAVPATGIRFFQLQGYPATVAVSSGALDGASDLIIKLVLFLIAVPVPWHEFRSQNSLRAGSHAKVLWLILAIVVVTGLVIAVVLAVPKWRHQVSGKLRKGWGRNQGQLQRASRPAPKIRAALRQGSWQPSSS
jgi:hypothetical protein